MSLTYTFYVEKESMLAKNYIPLVGQSIEKPSLVSIVLSNVNMNVWVSTIVLVVVLSSNSYCSPIPQSPTFNIPFENMLGNTKPQTQIFRIAFKPDDGMKNRVRFEEKHGPRGEKLIASFGSGAAPGPATFLDDHVINRNNKVVKNKRRHQDYSTNISYETPVKN